MKAAPADKAVRESAKAFSRRLSQELGIEMVLETDGPLLRLKHLKVPIAKRGRGIGTTALEHVKEFADQMGTDVVLVAQQHLSQFYERNGFKQLDDDHHAPLESVVFKYRSP